jgi:hypothetical protein
MKTLLLATVTALSLSETAYAETKINERVVIGVHFEIALDTPASVHAVVRDAVSWSSTVADYVPAVMIPTHASWTPLTWVTLTASTAVTTEEPEKPSFFKAIATAWR